MAGPVTLTVNGEPRPFEGRTLADLVASAGGPAGRLACEVNGRVVRRADYALTPLHDGDNVEIVHMIGGG